MNPSYEPEFDLQCKFRLLACQDGQIHVQLNDPRGLYFGLTSIDHKDLPPSWRRGIMKDTVEACKK